MLIFKKEEIRSITSIENAKRVGGPSHGFSVRLRTVDGVEFFHNSTLTGAQAHATCETFRRDLARHGEVRF